MLDKRLAAHEYVGGDYSIADMAIWPWVSRYEWQTVDLNKYPNVKRWYLAIANAPGGAEGLQGAEGRRRGADPGVSALARPRGAAKPAAPAERNGAVGRPATLPPGRPRR